MYGGIDQLVDTYKGNPQPLADKVQKAQQGQPPGAIPQDLEEALALQQIAELRQGAQGQQAMQAGGTQPSVVQKLRQMLGAQQAQAQMPQMPQGAPAPQGQPVMAAHGGSIAHLVSNLGQHYAGGGIVAFSKPTDENNNSLVDDPDKKPLRQMTLQELAEEYNRKRWAQQKEDEETPDPNKQLKDQTGAAVATGAGLVPALSSAQMAKDIISRNFTQPVWRAGTSAPSILGQTAAGAAVPLATVSGGTAASYKAMKDLQAMSPEQRRALAANPMLSAMSGDAGIAAAIQEAANDETPKNKSSYWSQMGNALSAPFGMAADAGITALKHLVSAPGYGLNSDFSDKPASKEKIDYLKPSAAALAQGVAPMPGPGSAPTGGRRNMDQILAAQAASNAGKQQGAPGAGNAGIGGGPAKPAEEPMDPLEKIIRDNAMKVMGQDPEEVRRKAIEANAKAMGLDALLKPAQERAANREAMIKQIQAGRQPLWIDALMSANKPTKSGVAGVLQNMAVGANATKQGYDVEDLRFIDELNKLHEGIDKAKIEGRYKDVAAGEAAVKDLISSQRQAEQSGTSLLNTKENVRGRIQSARDAAAGRAQSASQHAAQMALALEEKKRQFDESQSRKIREQDVARTAKIESEVMKIAGNLYLQAQMPSTTPEKRADLMNQIDAIAKRVEAKYPPIKPEATGPTVGTVTGGYKFKGGDPADKNNWEKV